MIQKEEQRKEYTSKYMLSGESSATIGAVIMLVVGVSVATLVMTFTGALSGQVYNIVEPDLDLIGKYAVSGDVFLALNSTAASLDHSGVYSGSLSVLNGTEAVGLGNFTVDYGAGTLTLLNNAYNNTNLTAAYDYANETVRGPVKRAIISSFAAQEQTGNYLPLIVLAVVITLILGLVLGMTAISGNGGNYRGSAL